MHVSASMSIKLLKLKTVYSSIKTTYKAQTASLSETCKKKNLQNNRVLSNILKYTAEFSKNPSTCPERCLGQNTKAHTDGVLSTEGQCPQCLPQGADRAD